jgi:hypothetical protein
MKISWQYVAGFFDGEGCIGMYPDPKYRSTRVLVQMSQAEPQEQVLYEIQEFLSTHGISFTTRVVKPEGNRKPCHQLYTVNRVVASEFLKQVEPYLRVKLRKAKELIAWADNNPARRGAHKRPIKKAKVKEILEMRESGMSQREIAEVLGISNQVMVGRILRRNLTIPV